MTFSYVINHCLAGPLMLGAVSQLAEIDLAANVCAVLTLLGAIWYLLLGAETLPGKEGGSMLGMH